jgi:predicted DCC family thiol-disulfide oxidoreductase YuxK
MIDLQNAVPLVIYDNKCYLCTKFAKIVNFVAGGRLSLVGHYTDLGEKLRSQILDSSALEMFWFVDGKTAFGGRAALIPLILAIIRHNGKRVHCTADKEAYDTRCKTAKAAFFRSASLFTHSKKIRIN